MDAHESGVHKRVVFRKGGFGGCSPGTKTGTMAHSDVPPERKPERGYIRMFPWNKNPERGHIRQNYAFTKSPFCLLSNERSDSLEDVGGGGSSKILAMPPGMD